MIDILLILVPMSYADLSTARQLACYRIGFIGCDIGPTCFVSHSMSGSDDAWLTLNLSREQSTTFQTGLAIPYRILFCMILVGGGHFFSIYRPQLH